ncbi:hypothetical protein D3C76_1122310 [compost metagenome]
MLTDGGGVKPVAGLHVYQRLKLFSTIFRALHLPQLPDPFDVSLHKVSSVRFTAVSDHLNRRIGTGARHIGGKIDGDNHQPANFPGLHLLNQLLAVIADGRVDIGRAGHRVGEIQRFLALLLQ